MREPGSDVDPTVRERPERDGGPSPRDLIRLGVDAQVVLEKRIAELTAEDLKRLKRFYKANAEHAGDVADVIEAAARGEAVDLCCDACARREPGSEFMLAVTDDGHYVALCGICASSAGDKRRRGVAGKLKS